MISKLMLIAVCFVIAGIVLFLIAALLAKERAKTEFAIGGFIGPIPFGFFSSSKAFWLWIALAALLALFLILWKILH